MCDSHNTQSLFQIKESLNLHKRSRNNNELKNSTFETIYFEELKNLELIPKLERLTVRY